MVSNTNGPSLQETQGILNESALISEIPIDTAVANFQQLQDTPFVRMMVTSFNMFAAMLVMTRNMFLMMTPPLIAFIFWICYGGLIK